MLRGYYLGALGVDAGFVFQDIDQTNHFYCQLPRWTGPFVNIWEWQLINGDSLVQQTDM